jgi:GNAT superfamily N-acetyltransferase
VVDWIRRTFQYDPWVNECDVSFANKPASCFVAIRQKKLVGFACYDATCKDFFGPMGVDEAARGQGIGGALLLTALRAMREQGYAYAIIGSAGPVEFYAKECGATLIEGSVPGIFRGMLRAETSDKGKTL